LIKYKIKIMKESPFVIERVYDAPVEKVWKAISDKDQMKKWYFDVPDFKPEVGNEFTFWGGTEKCRYLHLCKVMEVIPLKKLKYSWRYDGYEGNSFVTFELTSEEKGRTRLKLTHEGLETFPSNVTDFAHENFAEGWNAIIGKLLPEFLQKETVA
jgi:uncharacterized protein YndB with AHSA1/START domain